MPRRPDPDLEGRILDAAQRLWKKGGAEKLTMRSVALAAGTNTPAVYRRFRDRDDILRALVQRTRQEFTALIEPANSVEEVGESYLDFALSHAHEYELFYQHEYELFYSGSSRRAAIRPGRPGMEMVKRKMAERLGGSPGDHTDRTLALWMLAHGAAMLLISRTILPKDVKAARAVFRAAVKLLLREAVFLPQ